MNVHLGAHRTELPSEECSAASEGIGPFDAAGHCLVAGHRAKIRADLFERLGTDPPHSLEILVVEKRPFFNAGLDDPAGERLADARQLGQLRPTGGVQIDLEASFLVSRPFHLHEPIAQSAVDHPPENHRSEPDRDQGADGRLVRPSQDPRANRRSTFFRRRRHGWDARDALLVARQRPTYYDGLYVSPPADPPDGSLCFGVSVAVPNEFREILWDDAVREELRQIVRLAIREDLGSAGDLTSRAVVPENLAGRAAVAARQAGVVCGLAAAEEALGLIDPELRWTAKSEDGRPVAAGDQVGVIAGPARTLLSAERLVLNVLGRLSGVATLTRRYVEAVAGTHARIYDTRKTTPGWRRLEKYAVCCGGGWNHRLGLFDAVLIKDNHLALGAEKGDSPHLCEAPSGPFRQMGTVPFFGYTPAEAVRKARRFIASQPAEAAGDRTVVEIEVDTLEALEEVLSAGPDVVLLDNMTPEQLRRAVAIRDAAGCRVPLEASGGVSLANVAEVAASGVDRISVGAVTHAAPWLDFGLDWMPGGR